MLSKTQIQFLKGMANTLKANYQIGKNEITDSTLDMLSKALDKYELIKISVNKSVMAEKATFAAEIAEVLHAELIQLIGGVIVIYRKNLKEPKIKLPR